MAPVRIAIAQVDTTVGDLVGNVELLTAWAARATEARADVVVFPELALTGYPPEDLVLRSSFVDDNLVALDALAGTTTGVYAYNGRVPGPMGSGHPSVVPYQAFRTAEKNKQWMIGYFYEPQWFLSEVDLVKVDLPEYTDGCDADAAKVACDYPAYDLNKVVSTSFAESGSPAVALEADRHHDRGQSQERERPGEAAVDGWQQGAFFARPALALPEPCEAHRRPKLPRQRALTTRPLEGLPEVILGDRGRVGRVVEQDKFALQAQQLGEDPTFLALFRLCERLVGEMAARGWIPARRPPGRIDRPGWVGRPAPPRPR